MSDTDDTVRQVPVWDLATRIFHWSLVLFVAVCLLTGEEKGFVFAIHAYAGFVVLVLLVFRIGWGLVGSRHSRFADFIYSWPTVRRYAASVFRFRPEHYVGHNPLGGWMIVLMLIVLMAAALSGTWMVASGTASLDFIHEAFGNFVQILVFIHIAGVLADRLLTREKIVRAMFTGDKALAEDRAGREVPLAGTWRAVVLAVLVVAGGVYMFREIDYSTKISAFAAKTDDASRHEDDTHR